METFSWMAALALLSAAPSQPPAKPSPAQESVTPDKRPADRPAHESPYSAFGAPHARRSVTKRARARLHCADGTVQTQGQKGATDACAGHGGAKK